MARLVCFLLLTGAALALANNEVLHFEKTLHGETSCRAAYDPTLTAEVFPKDFLFGLGSSAIQAEGALGEYGQGETIWEKNVARPGYVKDGSSPNVSCDSYHHFWEDVGLLKAMGLTSYRFSISWARIMPNGTLPLNPEGVAYYHRLLNALTWLGIEPLVTLYHLDLPANLHETMGGWLNSTIKDYYTAYADFVFQEYGSQVRYWMTFNEPNMFIKQGYATGQFAPCMCTNRTKCVEGNSSTDAYVAAHNALLSHASVVDLYRTKYQVAQGGQIGTALLMIYYYPFTNSEADIEATERAKLFTFGWFADPLLKGDYPEVMKSMVGDRLPVFTEEEKALLKGSLDFLGVNSYTANFIKDGVKPDANRASVATDAEVIASVTDENGTLIGPATPTTFIYVVPFALADTLLWANERYPNTTFILIENGVADMGNDSIPMAETLCDQKRIDFYTLYLKALLGAMKSGVDVRGFVGWSLVDNWEWTWGYTLRYGAAYVDYNDPARKRHPKMSFHWWAQFMRNHAVVPDNSTAVDFTGVEVM